MFALSKSATRVKRHASFYLIKFSKAYSIFLIALFAFFYILRIIAASGGSTIVHAAPPKIDPAIKPFIKPLLEPSILYPPLHSRQFAYEFIIRKSGYIILFNNWKDFYFLLNFSIKILDANPIKIPNTIPPISSLGK